MNDATILAIRKENSCLKKMFQRLQNFTQTLMEVSDPQRGLAIFDSLSPDLVIVELSDQTGLEFISSIAKITDLTPIIVISEETSDDAIISTFKAGAWDYLLKEHIESANLIEAVETCLHRSMQKRHTRETGYMLKRLVEDNVAHLKRQKEILQAEIEKRKRLERIISQAKREWEHTIDSIPDYVALIDQEHRIVRLNRPMADAFGMHPREVIGRKCFELAHGSNHPPGYCPHRLLIKSNETVRIESFEKRLGGHIEITATPFRDPDGTVIGSVHIVRNINHRKEAEAEKERMNLQLLQTHKLEAVGQLAAGIAHEINTPIQYVGSNLDFFLEAFEDITTLIDTVCNGVKENPNQQALNKEEVQRLLEDMDWQYLESEIPNALEQAKEGVSRITKIVRAMKEFSHPGNKEKTPTEINKIIETAVTIAKNEWKYCSEVKLQLQDDLPLVPCLRDELGQVLLNMLVNAAQAISAKLGENPEGEKGQITIKTAKENGTVQITIQDTGTGIPKDIRQKIFEPFFTTKSVGKGTGQGLAICRDVIVEKHGGNISVESVEGEGTTFTITIPLAEETV